MEPFNISRELKATHETNLFAKHKRELDKKKNRVQVKNFDYFIKDKRPKAEVLEYLKSIAYRLNIDSDDLYQKPDGY